MLISDEIDITEVTGHFASADYKASLHFFFIIRPLLHEQNLIFKI